MLHPLLLLMDSHKFVALFKLCEELEVPFHRFAMGPNGEQGDIYHTINELLKNTFQSARVRLEISEECIDFCVNLERQVEELGQELCNALRSQSSIRYDHIWEEYLQEYIDRKYERRFEKNVVEEIAKVVGALCVTPLLDDLVETCINQWSLTLNIIVKHPMLSAISWATLVKSILRFLREPNADTSLEQQCYSVLRIKQDPGYHFLPLILQYSLLKRGDEYINSALKDVALIIDNMLKQPDINLMKKYIKEKVVDPVHRGLVVSDSRNVFNEISRSAEDGKIFLAALGEAIAIMTRVLEVRTRLSEANNLEKYLLNQGIVELGLSVILAGLGIPVISRVSVEIEQRDESKHETDIDIMAFAPRVNEVVGKDGKYNLGLQLVIALFELSTSPISRKADQLGKLSDIAYGLGASCVAITRRDEGSLTSPSAHFLCLEELVSEVQDSSVFCKFAHAIMITPWEGREETCLPPPSL